jgi:type IV pilus assembly protein PilQ
MKLYRSVKWVVPYFCLPMLLFPIAFGCSEKKKDIKKNQFYSEWKARAESSKGYTPVEKSRKTQLHEKEVEDGEKKKDTTENKPLPKNKITLKLKDTGVDTILRALARSVDLNILVNDGVSGRTSINVKEARWDQLFNGILRGNGLTYTWEGDLIRVMTTEDMEKDLARASHERDIRLAEPLFTNVVSVNYADANKLKGNLEKLLSKGKNEKVVGSVLVDEHTRSLLIRAVKSDMDQMVALVEELDKPISQIRIEANIVEANKDTARELGIQWGGLAKNDGSTAQYITAGANSAGVLGGTLDVAANPTSGNMVNFPASLEDDAGMTIGFMAEKAGKNILAVQLSALQTEGQLNILSSPSITTLDNQIAIIESGTEVPYQTVSADGNINIDWKKAVLSLEVVPHIIDEKTLKLDIKTKKDELDFSNDVSGNPTIITKNAETGVVLLDGQTTVIGGLSKEVKSDSESGVPYLKDIPWLGYLFRGTGKSNKMEDVLIFITPHILQKRIVSNQTPDQTLGKVLDQTQSQSKHETENGNQKTEDARNVQPRILGRVAAERQETLWNMIRVVFGVYTKSYEMSVLSVNPHISDADNIDVGQIIYFPAVEVSNGHPDKNYVWVQIDEKDKLDDAYRMLRSHPDHLPPIRLIPYWNEEKGLTFSVVLNEYFFDESSAKEKIAALPENIAKKAGVIKSWGHGTRFYADPFLSYKES